MLTYQRQDFANLSAFALHPSNPFRSNLDPGDQQALVNCLWDLGNRELMAPLDDVTCVRTGASVCLYLSMVACDKSIPFVGDDLLKMDLRKLTAAIAQVPKGQLFRGGQRPYAGGSAGLAQAVFDFNREHGVALAHALIRHRQAKSTKAKKTCAFDIVYIIVNQTAIHAFKEYRQKRFIELLSLAGECRSATIALIDAHLDASASIYPSAPNTATGLRRVFPAARNPALQRQGIRFLQRCFARAGCGLSFARWCAMLCFDRKEASGRLQIKAAADGT